MKTSFILREQIPAAWRPLLNHAVEQPSFQKLESFLEEEYRTQTVFPSEENLFSAFRFTSPDCTKVVILGQDPYHEDGQAHGLAFSVPQGIRIPPSLRNIYKELNADLQIPVSTEGTLTSWAEQGILLLNTVLTVRAHEAGSHRKQGWEEFTDEVIHQLSQTCTHLVFVLWGAPAQTKLPLIDQSKHTVIASAHPSPFSAHRGFLGSRPFSKINDDLIAHGMTPVDWRISTDLFA